MKYLAQKSAGRLIVGLMPMLAVLLASGADGQPVESSAPVAAEKKNHFHLFNPTPRSLMRDMSTDRPDTTESPYTVDAGHFQLEMSFIEYTYNDDGGVRTDALSIAPMNLKVGLLNNVDLQFVFTPYELIDVDVSAGDDERLDGFSDDTQLRLKINLWGNDGPVPSLGDTALAVMPFVKFPTGSDDLTNDHVAGGIIVPLAVALPSDFNLGLMAEIDFVYNDAEDDYGVALVHTATLGHDIPGVENLGGYVEYIGIAPVDADATYQAIFSAGLTYALSEDVQLDCGGAVGLSDSADDFTLFTGMSFRL